VFDKGQAEKFKEQGNAAFAEKHYIPASNFYDKAIEVCPQEEKVFLAVLYGNRAVANLKMENFGRLKSCSPEERKSFALELQNIGCCNMCVLRYFGIIDSELYRNESLVNELIKQFIGEANGEKVAEDDSGESKSKLLKKNPCSACLGLLEEGVNNEWLNKIADTIKKSEIEALSYCPALSLPICIQIRAYTIWFHLKNKFPETFSQLEDLKPEGIAIKSVWKWLCNDKLRLLVNPESKWTIDGNTTVQINVIYKDEKDECRQLQDYLMDVKKIKKKGGGELVTRGTVQSTFQNMNCDDFIRSFKCPSSVPNMALQFGRCECFHAPIFIAGRYCKYSRTLSQTPWVIDGKRKTESSVEELITNHVIELLRAEEVKFSSSGREDVDVRTLGKGRPFACEVINPKRTIFTPARMLELEKKINSSTEDISVNSIQVVEKKDMFHLKHGEDSKTKEYCALCSTLGKPVTPEMIQILNNQKLPLVLKQRTPIRVLHRRTSSDRPRSILAMKADIVPGSPDLFTLRVTTEAGTYVKEFVHGDFGRTIPNVSLLLGIEIDIYALDVEEVNLDWPPSITKDLGDNESINETKTTSIKVENP